mgnify:CR=1 FL=1
MRLRPLNDVVIVDPSDNHFVSDNTEVVRIANEGTILLPESNSLEKKSNNGRIVSWGPNCVHKFKTGQRVWYPQWTSPCYFMNGEKRYRFFREYELNMVEEDGP